MFSRSCAFLTDGFRVTFTKWLLRLWEGEVDWCEKSTRGWVGVGRWVGFLPTAGWLVLQTHTSESCCPLYDSLHGAEVIVLFVHPHDKHGCFWRGCTDDRTQGTCLEAGLGKVHKVSWGASSATPPGQPWGPLPHLL